MISLIYGTQQQFRYRHGDINILGNSDTRLPVRRSEYVLNDARPVHFYVEPEATAEKGKYPYGSKTPSVLRLRWRPGNFNIEIPVDSPALRAGPNSICIHIEGDESKVEELHANFLWDPNPLPLPLNLQDLGGYNSIQEIGQVVNGAFEIDRDANAIRSTKPVGADILLLLGSPHGSQEATYDVVFSHREYKGVFLGLSDFFAGHEEQSPNLGIKPGYSTAGLATITPKGLAQSWMAIGDLLMDKESAWVVKNMHPPKRAVRAGVTYSVRHQVIMGAGLNFVRYRIWRKGDSEPKKWLCEDNNAHLDGKLPRISEASFGLFQYGGSPTQWSNICVRPLDIDVATLDLKRNKPLIGSWRKVRGLGARFVRSVPYLSK